nr:hypothetical protein [uncultured Fluviicola sp.]
MKLLEYIEFCLNEWPDEINMEGAYDLTNNLYFFPNLIQVHDVLQEKDYDYFWGVVTYEIFKYNFRKLRELFDSNDFSSFRKAEIDRILLKDNILKEVEKINESELFDRLKQFD